LASDSLSKTRTKRSLRETIIKPNAPNADQNEVWIDGAKIFPELIFDILSDGNTVKFRAPGDSMYPTIRNGDAVTVMPIEIASITNGDIILYRHKSGVAAHRVMHLANKDSHHSQHSTLRSKSSDNSTILVAGHSSQTYFILRGDAAVVFDSPVRAEQILGKVTLVEREGRRIDPYSYSAIFLYKARCLLTRFKKFVFFKRN
jgi:signal peptidase I